MYAESCFQEIYGERMNCRDTYEPNLTMDLIGFHTNLERNVETQNFTMKMINLENKVDSSGGYKQLCRFCLAVASKPINKRNMASFKALTNSTLVSASEYPRSICSLCEAQLDSASKFRVSLLDMERCWEEFFQRDFLHFIKSINISEEHIYDEIFLEIEVDAREDNSSSIRSMEHLPSAPLLDPNHHQAFTEKSFIGHPRSVQTLTLTEKVEYPMYYENAHYTRIMQNVQTAFAERDFSGQIGFTSAENMFADRATERNDDIVSLSYESVNKRLPTANKLYDTRAQALEGNKIGIKCVVVGDAAVGKTNLILSYLKNKFDDRHMPTASDIYKFDVDVNKRLVQVVLCDTAGQDSMEDLRQLSYPGCNVFLLCFSIAKPDSFDAIKHKWEPKFRNTGASLVLVGTQSDLRSDGKIIMNLQKKCLRPVSSSDAQKLAKSIGAKYMETSSRNNKGVKNTFDTAIENALNQIEPKDCDAEIGCFGSMSTCCVG